MFSHLTKVTQVLVVFLVFMVLKKSWKSPEFWFSHLSGNPGFGPSVCGPLHLCMIFMSSIFCDLYANHKHNTCSCVYHTSKNVELLVHFPALKNVKYRKVCLTTADCGRCAITSMWIKPFTTHIESDGILNFAFQQMWWNCSLIMYRTFCWFYIFIFKMNELNIPLDIFKTSIICILKDYHFQDKHTLHLLCFCCRCMQRVMLYSAVFSTHENFMWKNLRQANMLHEAIQV